MGRRTHNPRPEAYDPQPGYRYQILCRNQAYSGRTWEHCDYAVDREDKKHLLSNYRQAYGAGWEFKTIMLPQKYWPGRAANPGERGVSDDEVQAKARNEESMEDFGEYYPGWKVGDFELLVSLVPQPPFEYQTECECEDGETRKVYVSVEEVRNNRLKAQGKPVPKKRRYNAKKSNPGRQGFLKRSDFAPRYYDRTHCRQRGGGAGKTQERPQEGSQHGGSAHRPSRDAHPQPRAPGH